MFWYMHSRLITVCMYSPAQHIRLHTSKNAGRFLQLFLSHLLDKREYLW